MSEPRSKTVMVAGNICLDITPVFASKKELGDLFAPGKLVSVGEADIHTGGAVANTGLALKFFGADVKLAAMVGNDEFGRMVGDSLAEYGCDGGLIVTDGASTSYSIVLAVPGVDRIFLHNSGASDVFRSADITEERLKDTAHFHFGYPTIMRNFYQDQGKELVDLFQRVKEKGITTSLDMAVMDPDSEAGKADWREILKRVMPYVDFFLPSAEELCYMLDRDRYDSWMKEAKGGEVMRLSSIKEEIRMLAKEVLQWGAKVVLIKCGVAGMYYQTAGGEAMHALCEKLALDPDSWCGREGLEPAYRQERIVSATGAGDTSIAAFLFSMLEGRKLVPCVQLANATGACCISGYDALSGLKPLGDLERKIDGGWEREIGGSWERETNGGWEREYIR